MTVEIAFVFDILVKKSYIEENWVVVQRSIHLLVLKIVLFYVCSFEGKMLSKTFPRKQFFLVSCDDIIAAVDFPVRYMHNTFTLKMKLHFFRDRFLFPKVPWLLFI